jgi:phosphate-selective porin
LQVDFAFTPRLLDAWLRVNFCKYAQLQIGQIKTPYTMDNFLSPLDLEFMELSQSVAALAGFVDISGIPEYANGLEIGAMLMGTLADYMKDGERIPILNYYAGIFGGAGINIKKDNLSKDFSARLDFYPFVKNFRLSGSVYFGNYPLYKDRNAPRNRWSAGAEYLGKHWTARAEYLQGTTGVENQSLTFPEDSVYLVKTRGLYAFVGYWFYMGWGKNSSAVQRLRPLFRYDYYVRDKNDPSSTANYFSFDLEWWPDPHVRVLLDYTLRQRNSHQNLGHTWAAKVSVCF